MKLKALCKKTFFDLWGEKKVQGIRESFTTGAGLHSLKQKKRELKLFSVLEKNQRLCFCQKECLGLPIFNFSFLAKTIAFLLAEKKAKIQCLEMVLSSACNMAPLQLYYYYLPIKVCEIYYVDIPTQVFNVKYQYIKVLFGSKSERIFGR